MQYHQLRMLCALRDKIAENDKSLTGHQAMDRARARMTRLGFGSRELFDHARAPLPETEQVVGYSLPSRGRGREFL